MQAERNGAMPMPVLGSQRNSYPMQNESGAGMNILAVPPRSPPKNKNTQHVPCKFFFQGQCQAGRTCPFSHDADATARPAPCKYFAKGGCKFGRKCALLHITPDGTVVNQRSPNFPPPQQYIPNGPPSVYGHAPPGLLSLQAAQGLDQRPNGDVPHDFDPYPYGMRGGGYDMPQINKSYVPSSPPYGSPTQHDRFATSPPAQGLSVLDAPLPNSFDSNGISWAARNGPFAASVPSKFHLESPSSSLPRHTQLGNTALHNLHNSAYGGQGMDSLLANMGSSPPTDNSEPMSFEKRPLHSDRLRHSRQMISASLGAKVPPQSYLYSSDENVDDDDDDGGSTDREEDLLPSSLHDLIPEGRMRKDSRSRTLTSDESPAAFLAAQRRTLSGHGVAVTQDSSSRLGSSPQYASQPSASSPSRFTGMFTRTTSRDSGGFGHVGSPLRDSTLSTTSSYRPFSNGDLSPSIGSPPRRQASASMSILTQELQRTKLDNARTQSSTSNLMTGSSTNGHASSNSLQNGSNSTSPAHLSNAATLNNSHPASNAHSQRHSLERGLSTASVAQRIDEEQELFDMDGVDSAITPKSTDPNGSGTSGNGYFPVQSSPPMQNAFGAIGGHRTAK